MFVLKMFLPPSELYLASSDSENVYNLDLVFSSSIYTWDKFNYNEFYYIIKKKLKNYDM